MKITFLILCYNQVEFTKECVNSISKNTKIDHNFLFINNGSTDNTLEYLHTIPNSFIINNNSNLYVNPAWNQGFEYLLKHNLGDIVCLCNNDIIAGNNWLFGFDQLFKYKQYYVPISNSIIGKKPFNDYKKFLDYKGEFKLELITNRFVGCCIFFKRTDIIYFYPVPESIKILHGDDWICDGMFSHGYLPYYVKSCSMYHHCSVTQRSMNLSEMQNRDHLAFSEIIKNYKINKMKEFNLYEFDTA